MPEVVRAATIDGVEERTLTDGTVWLSRPLESDIEAVVECCRDPAIAEWVTVPVPYGRADAEYFVRTRSAEGWAGSSPTWAIRLSEHGRLIGTLGLGVRPQDEGSAEIGYWLAAEHRRQGLISRAIALACDFGFAPDGMGLARIQWRAFVGNHASAAAARKQGFRYEGLARLGSVLRGSRRDHWMAARLNTDPPGPADGWPTGV
ncbi:GNAT family N-acetyltransferase [Nocardia testacea]|uniref:GNAT family N-acetyltransferase n=1 Tax=Nocardia testacea TaxID=248551 RepID=UPI003C2D78B3